MPDLAAAAETLSRSWAVKDQAAAALLVAVLDHRADMPAPVWAAAKELAAAVEGGAA